MKNAPGHNAFGASDSGDQDRLQRALSVHQAGRLDEAAKLYRQIITANPRNYYALHYLGMIEATVGNYEQAKAFMDRSLSIQPPNVQFLENYATVLFQMEDYESAFEASKHGLQLDNVNIGLLYVNAISLFKLGRLQKSIVQFDKLLSSAPNHVAAINERGSVLAEIKEYGAALASFEKALTFQPQYAEAHLNKGNVLATLRRYQEALVAYDRALKLRPDLATAWTGRGNVFRALNRYSDALGAYDKALAIKPDLADAWLGRGNVYFKLGRHGDALGAYDRAFTLKPDLAEIEVGRGNVFVELNRCEEALNAFDRALALKPELAQAWLGRGNVFSKNNRYEEALAAFDRAVAFNPELAEAWLGRGHCLREFKKFDEAFAAYDRALQADPNVEYAAGFRLHMKQQMCNWSGLDANTAQLLSTVREGALSSVPFILLATPAAPADQLQCARQFVENQPAFPPMWHGDVYRHDRIRLAYVSSELREHAVAYLTAGLFENHDRSRFEVTAIALEPVQNSDFCRRITVAFERFVDVQSQSDQEIAHLIRQLEIDVVVDLNGFTRNSRLAVFARRPAPVQVNYLGYAGTMGADYYDYIIADPTVIPAKDREFYSEKVVWLPDSFMASDAARSIAERTPPRSELGLPDRAFVFCCFNQSFKIDPAIFEVWMRLLQQVDGSVLWLKESNVMAVWNLRGEAERRGVDPARLIFAGSVPSVADHLARHRHADLFLDTLHYNAHTATSDALWTGVPVVTCLGSTFAGRVAASLLRAAGLADLVTTSLGDYEALALRLAHDPSLLGSVKAKLKRNRDICALFDTKGFTRHIEAAYVKMWEAYQGGRPPASFSVS